MLQVQVNNCLRADLRQLCDPLQVSRSLNPSCYIVRRLPELLTPMISCDLLEPRKLFVSGRWVCRIRSKSAAEFFELEINPGDVLVFTLPETVFHARSNNAKYGVCCCCSDEDRYMS